MKVIFADFWLKNKKIADATASVNKTYIIAFLTIYPDRLLYSNVLKNIGIKKFRNAALCERVAK